MLDTPVHRGDDARPRPLQALARVSEYLSVTLRADRGYNGVLTLNPAWPGPEYETSYLRAWPWELRELGEIIPDGWRIPAVPATAIGRNVALFKWAVKEAHRPAAVLGDLYRWIREFRLTRIVIVSTVKSGDCINLGPPWCLTGTCLDTFH